MPNGATRLRRFNESIVALYAQGMTTRDIKRILDRQVLGVGLGDGREVAKFWLARWRCSPSCGPGGAGCPPLLLRRAQGTA